MKSKCRNCTQFGKCGFVSYFPTQVLDCPDYKRGTVNHGVDVFMGQNAQKIDNKRDPYKTGQKSSVTPEKIESRVKRILADFPHDFKAKDLKDVYKAKHKQPLVFNKELKNKVCYNWERGILVNKCRVKRRKQEVSCL